MARADTPEQFALAGFEPAQVPRDNLFFAVFPQPQAVDQLAARAAKLRSIHGLTGKLLRPDRFHVTLVPLGLYSGLPQDIVAAAKAAAAAVVAAPFQAVFDRALSFRGGPSRRPFVLGGGEAGLAGLRTLRLALVAQLRRAGLRLPDEQHYTPHVTLLYDDHGVAEEAIDPVDVVVSEFVLVHSLVGQTVHVPLARWPLRG